jgi:hypothetical protein
VVTSKHHTAWVDQAERLTHLRKKNRERLKKVAAELSLRNR